MNERLGVSIVLLAGLPLAAGCGSGTSPTPVPGARRDLHSHARPDQVRVRHMDLDWRVDFDRRLLDGSVTLTIERNAGAGAGAADTTLHLDTRDLDIGKVTAACSTGGFAETTWRL